MRFLSCDVWDSQSKWGWEHVWTGLCPEHALVVEMWSVLISSWNSTLSPQLVKVMEPLEGGALLEGTSPKISIWRLLWIHSFISMLSTLLSYAVGSWECHPCLALPFLLWSYRLVQHAVPSLVPGWGWKWDWPASCSCCYAFSTSMYWHAFLIMMTLSLWNCELKWTLSPPSWFWMGYFIIATAKELIHMESHKSGIWVHLRMKDQINQHL